jgi:hypothetical protein
MLEFVTIVLAVIALPVIVEKVIILVDIVFEFIEEAVIIEFTVNVLSSMAFVMTDDADIVEFNIIVLPVMLEKKIRLVDIVFE